MKTAMERRRFRRAELDVPVTIRPVTEDASAEPVIGHVKDVSLAGVFCYVKAPCPLEPNTPVIFSITVPFEQVRTFPFTRLLGKGRVIRTEPIPVGRRSGELQGGEPLQGLALEFAPDVTALASAE